MQKLNKKCQKIGFSLKPTTFTEEIRYNISKRMMGDNNPLRKDPSKNRTAQPIRIHFVDGTIKDYQYAKQYCNENGVPYATMKVWLKTGGYSKKYGIKRIERI